jgi:hypothetical protein
MYLLQLVFQPVAVVGKLLQNKAHSTHHSLKRFLPTLLDI